ncbi:acetate--CoA ligase family protein [Paraburkholderia lacunae]|uniref:CoA-binding protein n=1 Tax=Paraburkholderia lacunae TaxID=2211104 RepID=A0A370MVJ2_9BURK|nr:acetate--CoA ligase family protein [Paraburkholderia lacunae]RDJ97354.1 CoA-binding protein [Paraburkholderia lacunae]
MYNERAVYRMNDLRRLIDPQTIAVVGASETPGSFGQRTLANLAGFGGKVFGVNPKYRETVGFPCVPTLADLPESPDCVVMCVSQSLVEPTLEEAIAIGAGGAIVYASGYAETGRPDRVAAQERLVDIARRGGIRIAGPNCVGLANVRSGAAMNFMSGCGEMIDGRAGRVAVVSQSGALGYTVLQAMARGVGMSHYLAAGNSSDVDVADFVAALADDPNVGAIICLFEGVKSGARFLAAARLADAAGKPLIVYKAGNTAASGKAALSHTGTLVGSVAAYRAALEEVGAIQTDDLEAVLELANFFARNDAPRNGRRVGIMATSGGAGVINADKAEQKGLELPALSPATREALATVVPDFGSIANPADLTAEVLKTASTFSHCLNAFVDDPAFSAVVVPLVFAHDAATGARAPIICDVAARKKNAIVAVWMNEWLEGPGSAVLDADPNVTLFRSADRCFSAIRAWCDWHERRASRRDAPPRRSAADACDNARAILAAARERGNVLSEQDSKRALAAYGIRVPHETIASTPDEAANAAQTMRFPLVVKIASPDIAHKTEVSGIRLNLKDGQAVRDAARDVLAAAAKHKPQARLDGVSVQEMAPPGVELVLGIQRDAQFGTLVVVGLGGVLVELLGDVSIALAPVTPQKAAAMLSSLKGYRLLTGYRGQPRLDVESAIDAICRFSEFAADMGAALSEADVNPVIVGQDGVVAADALLVLS